ncbi:MAG: heme ABC transporter permease [Dongiaceae bacterium]
MHYFANPTRFSKFSKAVWPYITALAFILLGAGFYSALMVAPPDYQQGEAVRIMYVHVPSAWLAMGIYSLIGALSALYLIYRHPLAAIAAESAAPIGACFTALTLITGMIWGKPMWGTAWVWDARLTSVLILLFLYLGYIALLNSFNQEERGSRAAAILALIGFINIPVIKFSVEWWNTLHQPASINPFKGIHIDPAMFGPLLMMGAGFLFYFISIWLLAIAGKMAARKKMRLRQQQLWKLES